MPHWVSSALIGLAFGLAVSLLNHLIVVQVVKRAQDLPEQTAKNNILMRYLLRFVINVAALFLVYKNTPMLIATAVGLTANKNISFFKQLTGNIGRKGVN